MKLITRDTDYALRAVCFVAKQKNRIVPVSELVDELKIPRPFLRKILQILSRERVLQSHKGSAGGFSLNKPADKIFLVDLLEVFQGPLTINECLFKKIRCPHTASCVLRKRISKIERYVAGELKSISIGSLVSKG